jgi:hypothetical protein
MTRMDHKKFIFVIRKPDGQEYDMTAFGRDETDAVRHLENLLDTIASRDTIVSLKGSKTGE